VNVRAAYLSSSRGRSCGCLGREIHKAQGKVLNLIHGKANTPIYRLWKSMKNRCFNVNNKSYLDYGGRGITVCERWLKFENFFADMGERPQGKSLDRINNNGGYEPSNCRWATSKQQVHNRRPQPAIRRVSNDVLIAECRRRGILS
jgi:hypothetical protein